MNPVKISELVDALDSANEEVATFVDTREGRVVVLDKSILSALKDGDEDVLKCLPDWQKEELEAARAVAGDSGERFVEGPSKFDFHEYRHMENFIAALDDSPAADHLLRAIRGKGAFRRFKDTAAHLGLIERWYRYREEAMAEFVRDWAAETGIAIAGDTDTNRDE